jgi:hypothetical protein
MNKSYQNTASAQPRLKVKMAEVQLRSEGKDIQEKISCTMDKAIQDTLYRLLDVSIICKQNKTAAIWGFSLCPQYSIRQLRKINHMLKRKHGRAYLKSSRLRSVIGFPVRRQLSIKQAFNGGIKI